MSEVDDNQTPDTQNNTGAVDPQPKPVDIFLSTLEASIKPAIDMANGDVPSELEKLRDSLLTEKMPIPPSDDDCSKADATIAAPCAQREYDRAAAKNAYITSELPATSALRGAVNTWTLAKSQYQLTMKNASATMTATIKSAEQTFDAKRNPDSSVRNMILYYTYRLAVDNALSTFQAAQAGAAGTLATAAGSLLEAYVTYLGTIGGAEMVYLTALDTAEETFWTMVESLRTT